MKALVFERRIGGIGLLVLALLLAGCSDEQNAVAPSPIPDLMPSPTTPVKAVRAFEWCWDHRDPVAYTQLFSDDFLFACAFGDSAGRAFQGHVMTRFDELEITRHIFVGGGTAPPASQITLQFDQNLIAGPDPRPGKEDASRHQMIGTTLVLRVDTDASSFQTVGEALFFLVRGDSALIPDDLVARGVHPDAGRWYIERWEDETVGSPAPAARAPGATGAQPATNTTWCSIKSLYR